jgi:hypothetical protein
MKDTHLLPYILPNVFSISTALSPAQFASMVLPSLKPLFTIKEPPQNMLTLLDNLTMLQNKTDKLVFRERQSGYYLVIQLIIMIFIRCSPPCLQRSRVRTRDGDHLPHIQSMFPKLKRTPRFKSVL